jgi:hypothetical protein
MADSKTKDIGTKNGLQKSSVFRPKMAIFKSPVPEKHGALCLGTVHGTQKKVKSAL